MSIEVITILLFSSLMILLITGFPMAFSLMSVSIIFTILVWDVNALPLCLLKLYANWATIILIAIPLFILMGCVLERSGIAEDLYGLMYGVIGRLKGGLAMGTVLICTIFAAMTGISGAATVTMGIIALPSMLKRNYHKDIAVGCIAAGGALGILIPPSITMIVFALFAEESVGRLFLGGILPGLLLSSLFIIYIGVRSHFQPKLAPSVERSEAFNFKQSVVASKGLILPFLLIAVVLGSIFSGIATPTEASAVGAFGAIICALIRGKLTFGKFKGALYDAFRVSSMVFWIILGAQLFTGVYTAIGAPDLIRGILVEAEINRWFILIAMQLTLFVLGCFMEPLAIVMITTPIYVPVLRVLGFDIVWFGILFVMNMEMGYLTPPFGSNLFYLKGVVPPGVTMMDIYRSIIPFVVLQAIGLVIVMVFPQIALLLPTLVFG